MKVKVISRSHDQFVRSKDTLVQRRFRNLDPEMHPMEIPREYTRALNASKLDRLFAKPFLGALSGHTDSVYCLKKHPKILSCSISGSCNGEIRVWNLSSQSSTQRIVDAHRGFIRGLTTDASGSAVYSCGDDSTIKRWPITDVYARECDQSVANPSMVYDAEGHALRAIDHQWGDDANWFATASGVVLVWDATRDTPVQNLSWGGESYMTVKWNRSERSLLATSSSDRTVTLHDVRSRTPMSRMALPGKTNALCWNPTEPFNFTVACEDHNCYTFDMRKLKRAQNIHRDFVSAAMCLDYSPTGREFVAGSYDRSIRIFPTRGGTSREVYYTRRMQRVFDVSFSGDGRYVLSASDDANIRLWKARASEQLGPLHRVQKDKIAYEEALKKKYRNAPQIRKVLTSRHLPRPIFKARKLKHVMRMAARTKEARRRAHSKEGDVPYVSEREKVVHAVE